MAKLGKIVRKMHLSDNCVLVIKSGTELAKMQSLEELQQILAQTELKNIIVVVADDFDDLAVLQEVEMNKRGWYHMRTLRRVIHMERIEPTPQEAEDEHKQAEREAQEE